MSSSLDTVKDGWLDKPLLIEFKVWIKNDLRWRLDVMGYSNLLEASAFNDAVEKCLNSHTNKDYLECSDKFTKDLENLYVSFGIKLCDAIRLSWKWSD